MLNLLGRSSVERWKSMAIGFLAGLLLLAMWQVWAARAEANQQAQDRDAALRVAGRFAAALTTYDFAHIDVYVARVAALSSAVVVERLRASYSDVVSAKASSIGDVTEAFVAELSNSHAEVLVGTSQVVSGNYTVIGTKLIGLIKVTVDRLDKAWVVADYRWLSTSVGPP
jgi:hypothetical protein